MTADTFQLFVPGTPAAQGSKRHVGHGRMIEASKYVKPWRDLVVALCVDKLNAGEPSFVGPVDVKLQFNFQRPRHHFGTGRNEGLLKPAAPIYPRTVGDVDKLCRALCDSLGQKHGAGVIADDADIVFLVGQKLYATEADPVGCRITVSPAIP